MYNKIIYVMYSVHCTLKIKFRIHDLSLNSKYTDLLQIQTQ